MSIETERLRLLPHTIETDDKGRWLLRREEDRVAVVVPATFHGYVKMLEAGSSIAQLAQDALRSPGEGRFGRLAQFLGFLLDAGVLLDKRAIRLAEALRPDYVWPEPLAFTELRAIELLTIPAGKNFKRLVRELVVAFSVISGGACFATYAGAARMVPFPTTSSAFPILVAFVLTFAVGRSLRSLMLAFVTRILTRSSTAIRARVDAVSISLASTEISKARGGSSFLVAAAGALLWNASPVVVLNTLGLPDVVTSFVPSFTSLLLLADLSPFRHSALTEWLRALYNHADREAEKNKANERPPLEERVRRLQVIAFFLWGLGLGIFLVGTLWKLIAFIRGGIDFWSPLNWLCLLLIGSATLLILVSFADDLLSISVSGGEESRLRKLWRRGFRQLAVNENIQTSPKPTRSELQNLPFLRQFEKEAREEILSHAETLSLTENQSACREGDPDRRLFILLSGKMAVTKTQGPNRRRVVAILEPGSVFGEAGFFLGKRRTADVIALEESRVLAIPHSKTMVTLDPSKSEELQARIWFLQALVSSELFKGLPSEALDAVVFSGTKRIVKAGEKLMSEGERADACYFLVQGQASVVQNTQVINKMKAGDVFGEIALLKPETLRSATVITDCECLVIRVEASRFWELLCSHLPLALEIERVAEQRLARDKVRSKLATV